MIDILLFIGIMFLGVSVSVVSILVLRYTLNKCSQLALIKSKQYVLSKIKRLF